MVTMEENSEQIIKIKRILRALLLSVQSGLTPNELCSEYYAMCGNVLEYNALGYNSAIDMFKDMPDVMEPRFYRDENQVQRLLLRGIPDAHTAHIRALVDHQKRKDYISKLYSPQSLLACATKRPVSSFIQSKVLALLEDFPAGLDIDKFDDMYAEKYGKKLNPLLIGFTSLKGIIEACSDIVKYEYVGDVLVLHAKRPAAVSELECLSRTNISSELKLRIFSLLMKYNHNGGLYAAQLATEYKEAFKMTLNFQALGYQSIVEMMSKLPDAVEIQRPTSDGDFFLIPKMCILDDTGALVRRNYQYRTLACEVTSQLVGIRLTYVVNPSLFWFQLSENSDSLNDLMGEMNRFYDSYGLEGELDIPGECVVIGHPCVSKYSDGVWYRAVVRRLLSDGSGKVNVFFVDFGDSLDVERSCLRVLRSDLAELPIQAIAGRMNIRHVRSDWTTAQTTKFFEMTHDAELYATIMDTRRIVSLELCSQDGVDIGDLCREMIIADQELKEVAAFETSDAEESLTDSGTTCSDDVRGDEVKSDLDDKNEEPIEMVVKCVPISEDHVLHIFSHGLGPCITSTELSALFWEGGDIVKHMLRRRGVNLNTEIIPCANNEELFTALLRFSVKGVADASGVAKPSIPVYKLMDFKEVIAVFNPRFENAVELVEKEMTLWMEAPSQYWKIPSTDIRVPEQERESCLHQLETLKSKRKQLYEKILRNKADKDTLLEIDELDERIKSCVIK